MKLVLNWRQVIPSLVTICAMMCGFFSILVTAEGMRHGGEPDAGQYHLWAAQLIMLALVLDGLDGNLARWLKGCSSMGAELDTYVDLTAFGIAPALLIWTVSLQGSLFWRVVMTAAVVMSGMVRLARFKATDPHRGQMGYSGLPITVCASWVALFVYISQSEPRKQIPWLTEGPWAVLFLAGIMVFIVLQVSTVRYPKPSKKAVMYIPAVILVLLLFAPGPKLGLYAAVVLLVFGLGYIVLGPFYMKRMAGRNNGGNLPQPANGDQ